jgi:hypothetical protein
VVDPERVGACDGRRNVCVAPFARLGLAALLERSWLGGSPSAMSAANVIKLAGKYIAYCVVRSGGGQNSSGAGEGCV